MNSKAISPIIGTMLLISLAVFLAGIIFINSKNFISQLAPPTTECQDIKFTAEIFEKDGEVYVGIVNKGNIKIQGFFISVTQKSSIKKLENIDIQIEKGDSKSIKLNTITDIYGKEFLIIPIIQADEKEIECPEKYGVKTKIP